MAAGQHRTPNKARTPSKTRASHSSSLDADLLAALKAMQRAYEQLIPGIRYIACSDYAIVNEAPVLAARAIANAEARA